MSNQDNVSGEIIQQLLNLSTDDILELINIAGVVSVVMEASKEQRMQFGSTLLAFAHKAFVQSDCRVNSIIYDPETKLVVHYQNGDRVK